MKSSLKFCVLPFTLALSALTLASMAQADEAVFVAAAQKYVKPYHDAKNDLQKSALRKKRAADLEAALGGKLEVNGWTGILKEMRTTSDGDAYITVEIAKGIEVKTWNNSLSDSSDGTLIKIGTPLFDVLAEMDKGSRVRFSGTFFSGQDFLKETSLTESGSMSEPEFLFRFASVNPQK